jgi:hypothetical protein
VASARDFQDSEAALSYCFGHQLSTIALHSACGENVREVVWSVTDSGTLPAEMLAVETPLAAAIAAPRQEF